MSLATPSPSAVNSPRECRVLEYEAAAAAVLVLLTAVLLSLCWCSCECYNTRLKQLENSWWVRHSPVVPHAVSLQGGLWQKAKISVVCRNDTDSLINRIQVSQEKLDYVVTNVISYCMLQHYNVTSLCRPAQFALPCSCKQKSLHLARCHTCFLKKCSLCGDIRLCTRGVCIWKSKWKY